MNKKYPTCRICGNPQFHTSSGMTCKNGHGGAPADLAEVPDYEVQSKAFFRKAITKVRKAHSQQLKSIGETEDLWDPSCKKCLDYGTTINKMNGLYTETPCDCIAYINQYDDKAAELSKCINDTIKTLFIKSGCHSDFSAEKMSDYSYEFGLKNRVRWNVHHGWSLVGDKHCDKFKAEFHNMMTTTE